jgi:hypothetical protein
MSAIASATLLRKSDLGGLAEAASGNTTSYAEFVGKHGRALDDYPWSGHVLTTLLCYLDEQRSVKLMKSEFDTLSNRLTTEQQATHFILTEQHKQWVPTLSPENFFEAELRDYFNEFNETSEAEVGRPMLDGILFIRDALVELDAESVVVLRIG